MARDDWMTDLAAVGVAESDIGPDMVIDRRADATARPPDGDDVRALLSDDAGGEVGAGTPVLPLLCATTVRGEDDMSEDTRLALLLDWVREFEALDDEGQDMHMRTLAGIASLDNEVSAGPFWRALASRTFSKPLGSSSSFVQVLK